MRDEDDIRNRGDEFVASRGSVFGRGRDFVVERGDEQQAAGINRGSPGSGHSQTGQAFGRTDDDGLLAAQEKVEALFFHRRMKATGHDDAGVAQFADGVERLDDDAAGALRGANQTDDRLAKDFAAA